MIMQIKYRSWLLIIESRILEKEWLTYDETRIFLNCSMSCNAAGVTDKCNIGCLSGSEGAIKDERKTTVRFLQTYWTRLKNKRKNIGERQKERAMELRNKKTQLLEIWMREEVYVFRKKKKINIDENDKKCDKKKGMTEETTRKNTQGRMDERKKERQVIASLVPHTSLTSKS